jgi:hypothetical protein
MDLDINSAYPTMIDYSSVRRTNEEYLMRVLNKKYWPHHVKVEDDTGAKERWCYENLKSSEWRNVGTYFAFKRGEDATLFTLRWL